MVVAAAIAFSAKAVIIKLAYRHGVDAVTLLALRMLFSAPLFALLAWWAVRDPATPSLSGADLRGVLVLGLVGYYLASYFDFLGLQHITAALERLILFVHPTFVLIFSALLFHRRITRRDVAAVLLSYLGIGLVFGQQPRYQRLIADVAMGENMVGITFQGRQGIQIAGISQRIEIDDADTFANGFQYEIAANKAGTTSYEPSRHICLLK